MRQLRWIIICAVLGLGSLVCGVLLPAHLRAVDSGVLEAAGKNSPGLVRQGLFLIHEKHLGTAQLFAQAADAEKLEGADNLSSAVTNLAAAHPELRLLGGPDLRLEGLISSGKEGGQAAALPPFTPLITRAEARQKALETLRTSTNLSVQAVLRTRALTNTVLFPPSYSSSGQAFDTAVCIWGLLLDNGHVSQALAGAFGRLVLEANGGGETRGYEQALLAMMSLGQRMDWDQLALFVPAIEDTQTLSLMAHLARQEDQMPMVFSAVALSGSGADVARYLTKFSQTGPNDLAAALNFGQGGVKELLQRNQPMYISHTRMGPGFCWEKPSLALATKWTLYFLSGFLLALALHFVLPAAPALERPLQVRGFHVARELLFGLGFLVAMLLLTEPYLAQRNQRAEFRSTLSLTPASAPAPPAETHPIKLEFMNEHNMLPIGIFFVLQMLLYVACLLKLAEIRRQHVPARIKLRLLENEEHLFDAGLYLGFVGTIISFIVLSLSNTEFSLMSAYSSTSFGIIGVSAFKIFHLRPMRRNLVMESEVGAMESASHVVAPSQFATHS